MAKIVSAERMGEYRWSSLAWFPRKDRPTWLEPSTVLAESGGLADTPAGWRSYRKYLALLAEKDPMHRAEKFTELMRTWALGSAAFRGEIRTKLKQAERRAGPFRLAGADRELVLHARAEVWEDQLRKLAGAFRIVLHALPRKKSAVEKLTLAAAMKRTTSVSKAWLAQRLQMGAPDSLGPLLCQFRRRGAMDAPEFKAILSRFLT